MLDKIILLLFSPCSPSFFFQPIPLFTLFPLHPTPEIITSLLMEPPRNSIAEIITQYSILNNINDDIISRWTFSALCGNWNLILQFLFQCLQEFICHLLVHQFIPHWASQWNAELWAVLFPSASIMVCQRLLNNLETIILLYWCLNEERNTWMLSCF